MVGTKLTEKRIAKICTCKHHTSTELKIMRRIQAFTLVLLQVQRPSVDRQKSRQSESGTSQVKRNGSRIMGKGKKKNGQNTPEKLKYEQQETEDSNTHPKTNTK